MKKALILAGAALLALAACNKTPEKSTEPVDFSQYKLRVEPVITRATETDFEKGDRVGLSVVRAGGDYATNVPLTHDGPAFSGDLNWYEDGTEACTLKAYYPYDSADPSNFMVQTDQSAGVSSSDFVSAVKENVLPSANAVAMTFKHQLSRLVVTLKNNSGKDIEQVVISEVIAKAVISPDDLTAKPDLNAKKAGIIAYKQQDDKYLIIIPNQTVAPVVTVKVGGKDLSSQLAESTLEPGKQYSVSVVVNKDEIKVVLAGDIENWGDGGEITGGGPATEEHLEDGYILYDGAKYSVKKLKNDRWIMTQSLRFVPEGMTVSSDPADGNGIWYPYTSDGTTATPVTDEASIEARGLLYDHQVAFGAEITAENFKSFEGTRGICPKGWHIPTQAEFFAIVGASNKTDDAAAATDPTAVYYDEDYKAGRIKTMNADGFNWDFAGSVMRNNNTATGKYQATILKSTTCSVEEWVGKNAITYYMGSTGYTTTNTATNRQFLSLMCTFTASYSEGKASIAYSNYLSGNPLRCIRDAE